MTPARRTYAPRVTPIGPDPESDGRAAADRRAHPLPRVGAAPRACPIVLIHGLTRTAWTLAARRLAAWRRATRSWPRTSAVTAPRDAPLKGYELESLALDVLTVVAGAGWGEAVGGPPVVVAGHGLGAMVAVEMARLAARHRRGGGAPRRRLGGDGRGHPHAARPARRGHGRAARGAGLDGHLPRRPTRLRSRPAGTPTRRRRRAHRSPRSTPATSASSPRARSSAAASRPCTAISRSRRWPQVRCPVTVLVASPGTADDEDERERRLAIDDVQRARAEAGLPRPMRCVTSTASATTSCAIGPTKSPTSWSVWPAS